MKYAYAALGFGFLIILLGVTGAAPRVDDTPMDDKDTDALSLSSPAFEDGQAIPSQYTCDGKNTNPPLRISGVPEGTVSLALVMDDPDIPQVFKDERGIDSFDHWTLYDIAPGTSEIAEGDAPGAQGLNGSGNAAYTGPCPPPEYEPTTHRYVFTLYALSGSLEFVKAPTKAEVLAAIEPMTIAKTQLIGTYDRSR